MNEFIKKDEALEEAAIKGKEEVVEKYDANKLDLVTELEDDNRTWERPDEAKAERPRLGTAREDINGT